MTCPHCQQPLDPGAVFCGGCGRRIHKGKDPMRRQPGRTAADSREETRKVPADPMLLEAAGGEPMATRRMSPDSRLLRMLRGQEGALPEGSGLLHPPWEEGSLVDGASQTPPPRPGRGSAYRNEDTAFLMEAAFRPGRSRLAVLLAADACLLLVGVYLITSWVRQTSFSSPPPAPMPPGARGYISWEDDGDTGRIATGPVAADFEESRSTPHRARPAPREPASREPAPREPAPREPAPREPASREPASREPAREAASDDRAQKERDLAERQRVLRAQERFLKLVPKEVKRHQQEIRRCYEQVLTLRSGVQGDVDVEFEVAIGGSVTRARASRNTTGSQTLGSCIAGAFMALRFPPPPGGPVTLRYPFRFTPRSR